MNTFSLARKTSKRFGWFAGTKILANRVLEKIFSLQGVEFVYLHQNSLPASIELPAGFESRFLTAEEVARFAEDPANDLDDNLPDRIRAGKDFCFAAIHENRLAAYGWYALKDIEAEHNFGISMRFAENHAYMYKGFTHSDFRGKRLHGILMGQALQELGSRGIDALVSSVGWTNFASLVSCDKLGYERIGRVWTLREGSTIVSVPAKIRQKEILPGCDVNPHLLQTSNETSQPVSSNPVKKTASKVPQKL
ncbi:MAG: GNAT family N-acetyltransferase [Planctomycetaceae bacterium]|nr:GNAT family N-acetyltransferase [Planctomycetaceae bacterium]